MGRDRGTCDCAIGGIPSFNPRARVGRDAAHARAPRCVGNCFNPRARVGRDARVIWQIASLFEFQSTRPRGARLLSSSADGPSQSFQSTRPRGARPYTDPLGAWLKLTFQSTRPRGARRRLPLHRLRCIRLFQSTRPRGARLAYSTNQNDGQRVSIHAPAWGATMDQDDFHDDLHVSIHAPAWGATGSAVTTGSVGLAFQSTRPRGARLRRICIIWSCSHVSIHAPAWGATESYRNLTADEAGFNPRARVGRDVPLQGCTATIYRVFQSTRPRGARPEFNAPLKTGGAFQSTRPRGARPGPSRRLWATPTGFNPRARVGRDGCSRRSPTLATAFQSTRPRGARRMQQALANARDGVSIHAPAWGATSDGSAVRDTCCPFQSTRPRGARLTRGLPLFAHADGFNPRARVGRDGRPARRRKHRAVSIHAPAWGAT